MSGKESLSEFLLARIAEDEEMARAATPGPWWGYSQGWEDVDGNPIIEAPYQKIDATSEDIEHVAKWNPARVLAECAAKRRIVQWCISEDANQWEIGPTLNYLALPYADHEDYQQEWTP